MSPSKKFNDEINAVKNFEDWSWHENAEKICAKNLADTTLSDYALNSSNPQLSLRKSNKINPRPIVNEDSISASSTSTEEHSSTLTVVLITGLITFSLSLLVFGYVKYKRPKRPCLRLNFRRHSAAKNFQRLNNCKTSTHSLNVNKSNSKADETNEDDEDPVINEHTPYDELNGYEYDDEFEMQNPDTDEAAPNVHSRINKDQQLPYTSDMDHDDFNQYSTPYSATKLGRITNKSLQHIKRFKTSLLSKEGFLKNVTNLNHPHFKQAQKHLFSKSGHAKGNYPHYTYNSTDSTLLQTRVQNEFQIATGSNAKSESLELDSVNKDEKSISVVTYDVEKKKSRQNVVKDTYNLLLGGDADLDTDENRVMRLATNPLDSLDIEVDNDSNTVKQNENESIA